MKTINILDKDIYWFDDFDFNGIQLFASRVSGSDPGIEKSLGCLILDPEQAQLLLHVMQEFEQSYQLNREYQTMLNHIFLSLEHLHAFLRSVKVEPA